MATMARHWQAMASTVSRPQAIRLGILAAAIAGIHVLGFGTLIYAAHSTTSEAFGIGIGLTAYGFGLRHAFDADHISAIDNTTRKLMADGQRPVAVGFFFSLGHSTIVFGLSLGLAIAARSVSGQVSKDSSLHNAGGYIGTGVSGTFLYVIAFLNLIILVGIIRIFRAMRRGEYDEETLEEHLNKRGLFNRFLGKLSRSIKHSWQMYPIGVLFGLGFDTATEVGLLALAGTAGAADLPWYAILCLPVIFAAGMSMMDTADGAFMSIAYGWAFSNPVRKVFYNITITGLSVFVALMIGTIEIVQIGIQYFNLSGGVWDFISGININVLGFVIVGLFLTTWAAAVSLWKFGRIEERWAVASAGTLGPAMPRTAAARKPLALVAAQTWMVTEAALILIGVLFLAIQQILVVNLGEGGTGWVALGIILATVVIGLALQQLATRMDRKGAFIVWIGALVVQAGVVAIGVLTAHNFDGAIPILEIGVPIIGMILLINPTVPIALLRGIPGDEIPPLPHAHTATENSLDRVYAAALAPGQPTGEPSPPSVAAGKSQS